jgi:hypothetical protein
MVDEFEGVFSSSTPQFWGLELLLKPELTPTAHFGPVRLPMRPRGDHQPAPAVRGLLETSCLSSSLNGLGGLPSR